MCGCAIRSVSNDIVGRHILDCFGRDLRLLDVSDPVPAACAEQDEPWLIVRLHGTRLADDYCDVSVAQRIGAGRLAPLLFLSGHADRPS
jgi:hypothetical protein